MKKRACFFEISVLLYSSVKRCAHAAIAQLDRVTDYESVGRGFESLSPYQKQETPFGVSCFCFCRKGTRRSNANVRWTFTCRRSRRRQHLTGYFSKEIPRQRVASGIHQAEPGKQMPLIKNRDTAHKLRHGLIAAFRYNEIRSFYNTERSKSG